jgi:GT2 family glycosyltransferase
MGLTDIIIPTHNLEHYTLQCLASIRANTNDYRIIWVDNASVQPSCAAVERALKGIPHVSLRNERNLGFVRAVNQGLEVSDSKFIVILNNDTYVTREWLDRIRGVFGQHPAAGLVGPLTSTDGSWQGVNRLRKDTRFQDDFSDLPPIDPDSSPEEAAARLHKACSGQQVEIRGMLAFFCVMTTRAAVQQVGGLSEEFGVGFCDDDDYCYRMRRAGYRLFVAKDALVYHHHRTTFHSLYSETETERMIKENKDIFKNKWRVDRMPFYKRG